MTDTTSSTSRVLYLMVCAAPPAQQTADVVRCLQKERWDVCVIATPQAIRWMDQSVLAQLTGHPVRTDFKLPGEADPLPKAESMLVMPATFNTVNKWAQGIGDTLVTSILCEALGRGTPPVLAVPCLKMDLVHHPVFKKHIALLRECGVHILHEPEKYPSPLMVPWDTIRETLYIITEKEKNP